MFLKLRSYFRNRFKSFDVCMGFCEAATMESDPISPNTISNNENKQKESSFVTEPPLGLRPDILEDLEDDSQPEYEEYDEERCQVHHALF